MPLDCESRFSTRSAQQAKYKEKKDGKKKKQKNSAIWSMPGSISHADANAVLSIHHQHSFYTDLLTSKVGMLDAVIVHECGIHNRLTAASNLI